MKSFLVLFAIVGLASAAYEELSKVEIEPIVANPEALRAFISCFLDKSVCNEQTGAFYAVHPEIVETRCALCSDKFKHSIRRFYEELPKVHPQQWAEYRRQIGEDNVDALFAAVSQY